MRCTDYCRRTLEAQYSLGAERFNGINRCGAGGREKRSGESSDGQEKGNGDHGDGVVRADSIKIA